MRISVVVEVRKQLVEVGSLHHVILGIELGSLWQAP